MDKNERKEKALAYVDEKIKRIQERIAGLNNALCVKTVQSYKDASKAYTPGMNEKDFIAKAKEEGFRWSLEESQDHYILVTRVANSFKNAQKIKLAYESILEAYLDTRNEIVGHVPSLDDEDDGFFYSNVLGLTQVGLDGDQLMEFVETNK